ncbi:MAG: NYN domain-containing protein [Gammaproteobacteria bacterium]|nr:NYN domain-containing protein [Gammaproteobacteria bacterium]
MERVAIFVDVQNIYYTVKSCYRCHFDYTAFWTQVTANREVVYAYAYAIDRGDQKQMDFQRILKNIGFKIKLKPFIERSDGSSKGDWDIGITIDILDSVKDVDTIVLASGDGDFTILLEKIHNDFGIPTEVYGVSTLTANSLKNAAQKYIPIEGHLLKK